MGEDFGLCRLAVQLDDHPPWSCELGLDLNCQSSSLNFGDERPNVREREAERPGGAQYIVGPMVTNWTILRNIVINTYILSLQWRVSLE